MRPSTLTLLAGAVIAAAALAGCGKAQEKMAEKATEKAIESSMSKDGTTAKVDLSQGAMKVTTTDAAGKTTQMEMGNAKVGEADVGLPFYPGSKPVEGGSMRIFNAGASAFTVSLHSDAAPDKVAAFYRDKMKALAEGKQLMDMSSSDGATLSLIDDKTKGALQVQIGKDDTGSSILISRSQN